MVILTKTKTENLTKEWKFQIFDETRKVLKQISFNLMSKYQISLIDKVVASSQDCREMNTDCQRQNFVDHIHLNHKTAVKIPKSSGLFRFHF